MSKLFRRGLVVGKFSPLHRGHEFVINRALEDCDEVVIISYCKPEFAGCEAEQRSLWLSKLFPTTRTLVVTDESLCKFLITGSNFRELPANDADHKTHRRFCGFLCKHVLGITVDAVFTSEDYGEGFAKELAAYFCEDGHPIPQVQHILVDQRRRIVPVSGTILRQDIHRWRNWLSPMVYESFVQRVCVLGGESSGKSTLTTALARAFDTQFVREYGRDLWEMKNGELQFEDLLYIGRRQIEMENEAAGKANRFLFCDTSPLTTLFYSQYLFGKCDLELEELARRRYDAVVLCAPDFAFVQDGTRQPESFRALQHDWYLAELEARKVPFVRAEGSISDRVATVTSNLRRS